MAGEPQLQQGYNDEAWVRYLQEVLISRGYDPGPVDGIFGPLTEAGVRAYQGENADSEGQQLVVDGIVGPKTWSSLGAEPAAPAGDGVPAAGEEVAGQQQSISVDHHVSLVMQATDNTCWAASSAMLLGMSEDDVVGKVGDADGDGADEPEMQEFTGKLGLTIVPPRSMMPEGWAQLLANGPVMVGIPGHYIVVAGIQSDGTYEGTQLHIFDPATGERWDDYRAIEQQYEIDADSGANLIQR